MTSGVLERVYLSPTMQTKATIGWFFLENDGDKGKRKRKRSTNVRKFRCVR